MGNHASLIRFQQGGKPVVRRGRNYIEFDNSDGSFTLVATIDKLHYGTYQAAQDVDTEWVASVDAAWQWQLLENDFNVHARNYLNAGDLIQWLDTRSGQSIIVDPQSINWVDNVTDSRQQISTKQAVLGTPSDAVMTWTNGYGTGRHFRYTAHPTRLIKHVIIDALANLPVPTVANPYFEIEFVIKKSAGVALWVDGVEWNNTTKTTTANRIEFKLANGTVAWYFDAPIAQDSSELGNPCPGIFQLRKQANNRFCTVRFPKSWVDAAVYPIFVDDTFTDGYGGDVSTYKDTCVTPDNATWNLGGAEDYLTSYKALLEYDLSSIDAAASITSATLYTYHTVTGPNSGDVTVYSIASGNASWIAGDNTFGQANVGEPCWNALEADGSGGVQTAWAGSAGLSTSGTDYEASAIGTFNVNGADAVGTEYTCALTTSRVDDWFDTPNTNYGILLTSSNNKGRLGFSENSTTGYRPKLVVVYTPAGGDEYILDVSGGFSVAQITGDLTLQDQKAFAGGITPSGIATKQSPRGFAGGATPSGTLERSVGKPLGGGITPSGVLGRVLNAVKALAGGITPTGTVTKQSPRSFAGAITPSGVLNNLKAAIRDFAGGITPSGVLTKVLTANRTFTGGITPSGVLTRIGQFIKTFMGGITPSGILIKQDNKLFVGGTTPTGALIKSANKIFTGVITPTGNLIRRILKTLLGTIAPSGTLGLIPPVIPITNQEDAPIPPVFIAPFH